MELENLTNNGHSMLQMYHNELARRRSPRSEVVRDPFGNLEANSIDRHMEVSRT